MGLVRPATPGFLVTLAATVLLALVSFNVPVLKSIFFLKATVDNSKLDTSVTFGTLGYCVTLGTNTTCSKPSVGYQLDINGLVGNDLPIQIPQVVVKWVTYALVLHIVALALSAISAVFGLLAHVREMSMTYCSTCVSGFAASIALIAFIFDLVLFFLTKSRINAVQGGHAEIGMAIWLTLAAWILLFFAGCFYGLGRCCVRRRPRSFGGQPARPSPDEEYAERVRLEAVKAEEQRKARQRKEEIGLQKFPEHGSDQEIQPLTAEYVADGDSIVPYNSSGSAGVGAGGRNQPRWAGGYAPATSGARTVDAYDNPSPQASPIRQPSSNYAPYTPPSGAPAAATAAYLSTSPYNHHQQPSAASYGHNNPHERGSSYHSAVSQPGTFPDIYASGARDPFAARPLQTAFDAGGYNAHMYPPPQPTITNPYPAPPPTNPYRPHNSPPLHSGYGDNVVPQYNASTIRPPVETRVPSPPTSPRGPRVPSSPTMPMAIPTPSAQDNAHETFSDSPPKYDAATAPIGQWGEKH